ncbi:MAG TPA: hypothetical protein VK148_05095 [Xanthobacteraceae bacterium]|nr:hypothetical protein [Xanthobacteraceae bacterium]
MTDDQSADRHRAARLNGPASCSPLRGHTMSLSLRRIVWPDGHSDPDDFNVIHEGDGASHQATA